MAWYEDERYYRIICMNNDSSLLTIVEMQWHDEDDYDEHRFLCTKGTKDRLSFSTEMQAIDYLNENIKVENIDPEYRVRTQQHNDNFYK